MSANEAPPVRLVVLDDHPVRRSGSVTRLGQHPQLEIVGDTAECTEALELAQELRPDAVIVETRRLDKAGLDVIALLSALDEEIRPAIVAYLEIIHRDDWPRARAAGADDVLLKEMPTQGVERELRRIVDRVRGTPGR